MPRPRNRVSIDLSGIPSLTFVSHQPLADINQIVQRGIPPVVDPGVSADLVGHGDYLAQCDTVARIQQGFARLPAKLRDHCNNDPAAYLALLHDVQAGEASPESIDLLVASKVLKRQKLSQPSEPAPNAPQAEPKADPAPAPGQTPNDD